MFAYANPIDALSGPAFLGLFALYLLAVLAAAYIVTRPESTGPRLPVPAAGTVDPHRIAYLRGGVNEVLRLIIFELLQDGYLTLDASSGKDPDRIAQMRLHPDESRLPPRSLAVFRYFTIPRKPGDIFRSPVRDEVNLQCEDYRAALLADGLLNDNRGRRVVLQARLVGAVAMLVPLVYRFITSVRHAHHNIAFMFIEVAAALVALTLVTRQPRLSSRGRTFLSDLKTAYRPSVPLTIGGAALAGATVLPLMVAVNGTQALAGTPYAPMNRMFAQQSSAGSDGSGGCGSCSSSGGGGGGDGGSCGGGCGGGGCS
jgi:uncharacterized protein (TIGR04222 family)